jgi:hypothetical protein
VRSKVAGLCLLFASAAFWLSWVLMPGVGVTDTATIFALVGEHRPDVFASVVIQLVSAAAYGAGVVTYFAAQGSSPRKAILAGGVLLAVGAMGSAADAVFHLVAYEMTAPAIPLDAVAPIMRRLQGGDLALLLPFVAAFFVGHALFVYPHRKAGTLGRTGARLLTAAPLVVLLGAPLVRFGVLPGRFVGLGFLGALSGSLLFVGLSLAVPSEKG